MRIRLPNNWVPRDYQEAPWDYLVGGGKRAVLKWHRRSGKDDLGLHWTAFAAHQRVGNYWYMLPEYSQARKSMWDAVNPNTGKRRIDDAFPMELRKTTRDQEMMIPFKNGSSFQLVGSDNFNSLVGSPPVGLVFSEYALSQPSSWGYLMPIVEENGGWAMFNSTPRGKNHFKNLCEFAAKEPGWFYSQLTADQSGVFSNDQLVSILRQLQAEHGDEYGMALWMQEYHVSFEAAMPGAIWGDCLSKLQEQGRIGTDESPVSVPHTPGIPVFTGWDLGYDDDTVCWYYQIVDGDIHVIDYHDSRFKDIEFECLTLLNKSTELGYEYGTHWLPHDARPRTKAAGGKSMLQQAIEFNGDHEGKLGRFAIAPSLDVQEGIQAARATFPRCRFDTERTEVGVDYLKAYRREYDEDTQTFSSRPSHGRESHACLVAGSMVMTARGLCAIENIRHGDSVWTPAGYSEVMNSGPVKVSESLVEITTDDGKTIICTPEHKVLTGRGFICADALRYNDTLFTGKEWSCTLSTLISTVIGSGFRATITGETSGGARGRRTSIGQFGSSIGGQFRKVMTFITSMATRSITTSAIFAPYCAVNTNGNTRWRASDPESYPRPVSEQESKLLNGMLQTKDGLGTQSMESVHGKSASPSFTNAEIAENHFHLQKQPERSSVRSDANSTLRQRQREESQDRSGNQFAAFAKNAASRLCRLFLSGPNTAPRIAVLKRIDGEKGRQWVFDLTVKKHACYQANGILVSNSDAFRSVALTWKQSKRAAEERPLSQKLMQGNVIGMTYGALRDKHLRKMRSLRQS